MNTCKKFIVTIIGILISVVFLDAQPTDNIIAYYPFSGNANDYSGNGNNGTATNVTSAPDHFGNINSAYSFNGLNSIILLPNALLPTSNAFCISFWFLPNGDNTCGGIACEGLVDLRGQYQIALGYNPPAPENTTAPNCIGFDIWSSPSSAAINTATGSIVVGNWYHIVANYGNDTMQLFVNGTLIGTQIVTPATTVSGYNNTVGKDYNTNLPRCYLNGTIDELLIYQRKLTTSEVTSIYGLTTRFSAPAAINYTSDNGGNRTLRNVITLKSYKHINSPDSIKSTEPTPKIDSTSYSDLNDHVKIYPNPTRGQLNIVISEESTQSGEVDMYDLSGKLIHHQTIVSNSNLIDLSGYAKGVYILRIELGGQTSTWKIIKE